MDKKPVALFSALLLAMSLSAQRQTVSLVDVKNHPASHDTRVPSVSFDDNDVAIKSDTLLSNVTVVVKNQYGEVMHLSCEVLDDTETIISVPDETDSQKTSVDLYYDDKHLRGDLE